jgi:hypothetical protein
MVKKFIFRLYIYTYKLFKEPNTVPSVKIDRLNWLGHIRRMDESSLYKLLTLS